LFEEGYKNDFTLFMETYNTSHLWTKFKSLPSEDEKQVKLVNTRRHYDPTVNVLWVMAHLNAAVKCLNIVNTEVEATGGSDLKKFRHPRYQKRIFYRPMDRR
jgi:tryptophan 2,3-dioxygenase